MRFRPIQTALAVVLGVATTVGVAWGIALSQTQVMDARYWDGGALSVDPGHGLWWRARQATGIRAFAGAYMGSPVDREMNLSVAPEDWESWIAEAPSSLRRFKASLSKEQKRFLATGFESGWPLLALEGSVGDVSIPGVRVDGVSLCAPTIETLTGSLITSDRVVPTRPIPLGFAADAAIYAAAWWVLLLIPGAVRRRVWAARGLCPRCTYDLSGVSDGTCPECGRTQSEGGRTG